MATQAAAAAEVIGDPDTGSAVLAAAREQRRIADEAESRVLQYAAQWAALHATDSLADAACLPGLPGTEADVPVAGAGAPWVAEFCVAEFAAALNLSTDAGRRLLGQAVELRHRLPRVWGRVIAGDLPAWRARHLADRTQILDAATAAVVDRRVAPFAHKLGPIQLERLIDAAIADHMPTLAEDRRQKAAEHRHFDLHLHDAATTGTVHVDGALDLADALDLETAIAATARELADLGSPDSLDVRRSLAVGQIARRDLTLHLTADPTDPTGDQSGDRSVVEEVAQPDPQPQRRRVDRSVVLYLHVSEAAVNGVGTGTGSPGSGTVGRCGNTRTPVLVEQVRGWCGAAGKVVVKEVIDLAGHHPVEAYQTPARTREQVQLRDPHCVFPWCNRPATGCDCDHLVPYPAGPTCACNLAPLCRRHHRHKTHAGWTYTTPHPGTYLWRSPHGYHYLVDGTGTEPADP